MNKSKHFLILVYFVIFFVGFDREAPTTTLTEFTEIPPYQRMSDAWSFCARISHQVWTVFSEDGRVKFQDMPLDRFIERQRRGPYNPPFSIPSLPSGQSVQPLWQPVANGWIVAFNQGEWDAAIYWISPAGKNERLGQTNEINSFVETGIGLLGLLGSGHRGMNDGEIIRFSQNPSGNWRFSRFVEIGPPARGVQKKSDFRLLVVTDESVVQVELNSGQMTILHRNTVWRQLDPNSVAQASNGELFIGMRHAVTRIRLGANGFHESWLVTFKCEENPKCVQSSTAFCDPH